MPKQIDRIFPCSACGKTSMNGAATLVVIRCGCGQLDVVSAERWGVRDKQGRIQFEFSDQKKFGDVYDIKAMHADPELKKRADEFGQAADDLGREMERFLE
jgi:hypothetical protein